MKNINKKKQTIKFPNPGKYGKNLYSIFLEMLDHPFKAVSYQVRYSLTKKNVLFGKAKHAAQRMGSLLPKEHGGRGTRNNNDKRQHCWENIEDLEIVFEYHESEQEAKAAEDILRLQKNHIFNT